MQSRIMYIEYKANGLSGPARIGRVTFSRSGRSVRYRGKEFLRIGGRGFKANYIDVATAEQYWISGCKKDGSDRLYGGTIEINDDVREEYWTKIRANPSRVKMTTVRATGKYAH